MIWAAVVAGGVGCYLLKLAGLSVPPRVLERPVVSRVADLIPVALLSALVAVQVFTTGHRIVLDSRAAGLGWPLLWRSIYHRFDLQVSPWPADLGRESHMEITLRNQLNTK